MASEVAEETIVDPIVDPDAVPEEETPSRKIDFGSKKIKIVVLLIGVMAVEAAAIYFLVPPPAQSGNQAENDGEVTNQSGDQPNAIGDVDTIEESIGTFSITVNQPDSGVIHLTFELVAIVSQDSLASFQEAIENKHQKRVRQAIVTVARSSRFDDIIDPHLGKMKRSIREEVNKVLGKSYIIDVVFPDFKYIEQ